MRALINYSWPGNVRELKNVIEKMSIFCSNPIIRRKDLPPEIHAAGESGGAKPIQLKEEEDERARLLTALERAQGNRSKTADLLGISRATLYRHLAKFNLT